MVPSDHHHDRLGQRTRETRELVEGVNDGRIHRANAMEDVARQEDDVGLQRDDAIDGGAKRVRDVSFTLVDARLRQPVVLTESEMQIGDMNEAHVIRG